MHAARVHRQQALAVYAESLAAGARVAVLGDASVGLASRLVELGARAVYVWDPDARRAAAMAGDSASGIVVQSYDAFSVPARLVDLVLVPDLGVFAEPSQVVTRARRLAGDEGVALIAAANREAPHAEGQRVFDYYELFDHVAAEFESVRMVAELPFRGVALVALGEGDDAPPVSVDTQLADGDRTPRAFIAVASQVEAPLDPYAIVELGGESEIAATAPGDIEAALADAAASRADAVASRADAAASRADAAASRARVEESELSLRRADQELRREAARAAELETALDARTRQLADLSAEVEEVRAAAEAGRVAAAEVEAIALRADRAEARVAVLERELGSRQHDLASRERDLASGENELASRDRELASRAVELASRDRELASRDRELASLSEDRGAEVERLESALRERAQSLQQMAAEIDRRDRLVRDLVGVLEEAQAQAPRDAGPIGVEAPGAAPSVGPAEVSRDPAAHASPWASPEVTAAVTAGAQSMAMADREPPSVSAAELAAALDECARLRAQLDAVALDVARREGEAQAASWAVAELERQLAQAERDSMATSGRIGGGTPAISAGSPGGGRSTDMGLAPGVRGAASGGVPSGPEDRALGTSSEGAPPGSPPESPSEELDVLRRALIQEHDARRRAESGEALAGAHAEIERLTVLLEQAKRDASGDSGGDGGRDRANQGGGPGA